MTNATYNTESNHLVFSYAPCKSWQDLLHDFHFVKQTATCWKIPDNHVSRMQALQVEKYYNQEVCGTQS